MKKQNKIFLLIIFAFSLFNMQKKEVTFSNYYYNLNLATIANDNNDLQKRDSLIIKTFNSFPRQNKIPIPYWLVNDVLKLHAKNNDIKLSFKNIWLMTGDSININPLLVNKYKANNKLKLQYKEFCPTGCNEFILYIDSLGTSDRYLMGQTKEIDTSFVPLRFKNTVIGESGKYGGANETLDYLSLIFEKFGTFGTFSCEKCIQLVGPIVHITNFDNFLKINDHLLELVEKGYLSPNIYAWAYDRSYNVKYGTFYYYFSLNAPFDTTNYKSIEQLTEKEKTVINKRRKQIGIPPLPYDFTFIYKIDI